MMGQGESLRGWQVALMGHIDVHCTWVSEVVRICPENLWLGNQSSVYGCNTTKSCTSTCNIMQSYINLYIYICIIMYVYIYVYYNYSNIESRYCGPMF